MQRLFCLVVFLVLSLVPHLAPAANVFYFQSSPTSWIGQGQTLTFTDANTTFGTHRYFNQGAYTNSVEISAGGYGFRMVGANYSLPTVGYYGGATRWPFMGSGVGMAFTGPGRANNNLTGWFNVLQADYKPDGTVNAFAVDFEQFDETIATRWNRGSVRFNS